MTDSWFPDCFTHLNSSLSVKPPKKSNDLKKKLSWLFSGKKQQRVEDTADEDGMPRWICMVMADSDQDSCTDSVLSRSLDLDLLRQQSNGGYAAGEELRSSPMDQVSPLSKASMLLPFRNRSRSVSPENFLGVGKLMARRRSESTAHRHDSEGKGPISRKSSILSDTSTGAYPRCSQTSDVSMLSPVSPFFAAKGDFDLKVSVYVRTVCVCVDGERWEGVRGSLGSRLR